MKTKTLFPPGLFPIPTIASLMVVFLLDSACGQETLYNFQGSPGGIALMQGNDGNFYGMTYSGGSNNLGTVFKMTSDGVVTNLISFNGTNGANPSAGLVQGSDGNFYGTTSGGGSNNLGTVFRITPGGALTTLATFNGTNGGVPEATLLEGNDGNFYGTTYWGGNLSLNGGGGYGTVFKVTPGGTLTTLVAFDAANGGHPNAGLIQGNDGNFYGTTFGGGDLPVSSGNSYGTVFRMTPAGDLTTLVSFAVDNGAYPFDGVIQAGDGNFYGTTGDGPNGGHTIFRLNTSQPLSFTQQPGDRSAHFGENVLFQSIALGEPPLSYQWYFNGTAISNATSPSLTIASVQSTNAGSYAVVVTNFSGSITSRVATLFQPTFAQFIQVATGSIVTDLGQFTRGAWGDFNNDGFQDLFVSSYAGRTNLFYLNNGDGTFTKVANGDPVQDADNHTGAAAADFDNDGNLDLLVSAGVDAAKTRNLLYHGNGDGTFSRVNGGGLTNRLGNFDACAWADYDNDGFVDVFITDNGTNNSGAKNLLLHNNGSGMFTPVTSGAVATNIGVGWSALWADYDDDGFMDLIVVNLSPTNNFLYHNNHDGTFTRILTNAIATDSWPLGAQGGAWGDYDNDGLPDLFVTANDATGNHLYHNNGNGNFTNITSGPELQPPSNFGCEGCSWGDYDNDGYLDLFVCGSGGTNGLYHNNGDGTFTSIFTEPPVNGGGPDFNCASVAWVDYDNDGFLDPFLTRGNANTPTSNLLFHNNGNTNGWLEVKLVGTVANRSAIGAKVRVKATIHGKAFWQLREITGGGGWNLQSLVAHFGLGDATNVDTLRIEWPSGTVQEFHDVVAKQPMLTITEPPRLMASVSNGIPQFSFKGGRNLQYEIQSSTNLKTWSLIDIITVTNLDGTARIADTNAPTISRFYRVRSLSGGVTGDDADFDAALSSATPYTARIKAAQDFAAYNFFIYQAQPPALFPFGGVGMILSIAYEIDPADPITLTDINLLQKLMVQAFGP